MFHLSVSGPSGMVFEHLQNPFNLEDSTNGFVELQQLCSHVVISRFPRSMVQVLGANKFLVLVKPFSGIHLIIMGEALYHLMNKALYLKFHDAFVFPLSPY
jgi:hypothetical protein